MANTKIPAELSSTPSIADSGDATAITIDSSEKVGIGTASPLTKLTVSGDYITQTDGTRTMYLGSDGTGGLFGTSTNHYLRFITNNTEAMRIDSSGNVGVGTSSPPHKFSVFGTGSGNATVQIEGEGGADPYINFLANNAQHWSLGVDDSDSDKFKIAKHSALGTNDYFVVDTSGNVLIGKTSLNNATIGTEIKFNGGLVNITNSGAQCITVNRLNSNGSLILFQQDNTTEGSISVSGTNVSYNGFTGTHESSGIASDTAIGTVCSTIDELDTYVSGNKEGQVRTDHAKIKVSDTEGDSRVYGVLFSYSEEDNKPILASVGISSVLVTGACAGGDLLESNGDGTAKVQDDDIIKSKTIGKVTIGNSDTNVKLVSCVLYCG